MDPSKYLKYLKPAATQPDKQARTTFKEVNEAWLTKVTKTRFIQKALGHKRLFRLIDTKLIYGKDAADTQTKELDLSLAKAVLRPSQAYSLKNMGDNSIDLVFDDKTVTLGSTEDANSNAVRFLNKICRIVIVYNQVIQRPDSLEELDKMLLECMKQMGMTKENQQEGMLKKDSNSKWQFIMQQRRSIDYIRSEYSVEACITVLKQGESLLSIEDAREMNTVIASCPMFAFRTFLKNKGPDMVLKLVEFYSKKYLERQDDSILDILDSLLTLVHITLKNDDGLVYVKSLKSVTCHLLYSLLTDDEDVITTLLSLLTILVVDSNEGNENVLLGFQMFQKETRETICFKMMMDVLKHTKSAGVAKSIIRFVVIFINSRSLYPRCELRNRFLDLGFVSIVDDLLQIAGENKSDIAEAIEVFNKEMSNDLEEVMLNGVNMVDPNSILGKIVMTTRSSNTQDLLLRVLRNMLTIPDDKVLSRKMWEALSECSIDVLRATTGANAQTFAENQMDAKQNLLDLMAAQHIEHLNSNYIRYIKMKIHRATTLDKIKELVVKDGLDPTYLDRYIPDYRRIPIYQRYFTRRRKGENEGVIRNEMLMKHLDVCVLDLYDVNETDLSVIKSDDVNGVSNVVVEPSYYNYFKMKEKGQMTHELEEEMQSKGLDPQLLVHDMSEVTFKDPTIGPIILPTAYEPFIHQRVESLDYYEMMEQMMMNGLDYNTLHINHAYVVFSDNPTSVVSGLAQPKASMGDSSVLSQGGLLESSGHSFTAMAVGPMKTVLPVAYEKYFKLKKMGAIDGEQIQMRMEIDKLDYNNLSLDINTVIFSDDPNAAAAMSGGGGGGGGGTPTAHASASMVSAGPLKTVLPVAYEKYFKLKKMGTLQPEQLQMKMEMEKLDFNKLSLDPSTIIFSDDPNASAAQQATPSSVSVGPPKTVLPVAYEKYFKLKKMGTLGPEQLQMKMEMDKLDFNKLSLDPATIIFSDDPNAAAAAAQQSAPVSAGPPKTVLPVAYEKYFKLKKMGTLQPEQLQMKMEMDKLDVSKLSLDPSTIIFSDDPNAAAAQQATTSSVPPGPPKTVLPVAYEKYFKLKKMGTLGPEQLQMKMEMDKLDVSKLSLDPSTIIFSDDPNAAAAAAQQSATASSPIENVSESLANAARFTREPAKPPVKVEYVPPPKEKYKPAVPLKPIYWDKVTGDLLRDSMWMKIEEKNANFDKVKIERLFGRKVIANAPVISAKPREESVSLLDPKRERNVGIMLGKLKMTPRAVRAALLKVDRAVLTEEKLSSLEEMLPTAEELGIIMNYQGDTNKLSSVGVFYLEMSDLPDAGLRAKCIHSMVTAVESIRSTKRFVTDFKAAMSMLLESQTLKYLLEITLCMGNYLNSDNDRGDAYGFKIDYLPKLKQTKGSDNKTSIITLLVEYCEEKRPDLFKVFEEILPLKKTKGIPMSQLIKDLNAIKAMLATMSAQKMKKPVSDEDRFPSEMAVASTQLEPVVQDLEKDVNLVQSMYGDVCTLFGEKRTKYEVDQLFDFIIEFVDDIRDAQNELIKMREMEAAMQKAAANEDRMKQTKSTQQLNRSENVARSNLSGATTMELLSMQKDRTRGMERMKMQQMNVVTPPPPLPQRLHLKSGVMVQTMSRQTIADQGLGDEGVNNRGEESYQRPRHAESIITMDDVEAISDSSEDELIIEQRQRQMEDLLKDNQGVSVVPPSATDDSSATGSTQKKGKFSLFFKRS